MNSFLEREPPKRPTLPPLFLAALSSWLCVLLVEYITWELFTEELSVSELFSKSGIIFLAITVLLFIFCKVKQIKLIPILRKFGTPIILISSCIALACSALYWDSWINDVAVLPSLVESDSALEINLTSDPSQRDYGTISNAEIINGSHTIACRIIWPEGCESYFSGHKLAVKGSVSSPTSNDTGRWNHQNGYAGTIRISTLEHLGYSDSLRGFVTSLRDDSFERISSLGGDASGLLAGILLGNKTLYSGTELELAFQTTGLAHLMAVSGTHLAIVTMLLSLLLTKTKLKRLVRNIILISVLLIYVAITGFAASALRSFTMCTVTLLLGSMGQRANILSGLSLCAFTFLGLSPNIAFSMGFQLSVLAVLGLVVFGNLSSFWITKLCPQAPNSIRSSVAATLAASFITLPVTVTQFAQLPLISPLSNIIAAPIIAAALCLGVISLAIGAIIPVVAYIPLQIAGILATLCSAIVRFLADIPGACLPISNNSILIGLLCVVFIIMLWVIWPVPKKTQGYRKKSIALRLSASVCAVTIFALPILLVSFIGFGQFGISQTVSDSRLVMLDVGQGDSILIQSGDASILVDTGEKSDVLIRELAEKSVSHLDAIFISHKDADHAGALAKLAGIIDIDHVYVHKDLIGKEFAKSVLEAALWATDGKGAQGVTPGFSVQVGEFTVTVVAPEDGGESKNDDSLILLVEFDAQSDGSIEARGVLTGDAEQNAMKNVVPTVGDIDFLKVAHHGSKGGLNDEELERLSPELALISVGEGNKYGHPNSETLAMLSSVNSKVYRTDKQGAISVYFAKEGMSVLTEK